MLPNFIIVGAMKAGTTTFHHYLAEVDGVFMPDHEVKFFSTDAQYARGMTAYERLFDGAESKLAIGERTTTYCYVPSVAERIHRHLPDVKLIWIFREPVARAYSNYWHSAKAGSERLDFAEAVAREPERIKKDIFRGYVKRSLYAEQVERYLQYFPKERMLFLLFEDFVRDPASALNQTLAFLNLSHRFEGPVAAKHDHATQPPRSLQLQWMARRLFDKHKPFRIVSGLNRTKTAGYPPMPEPVRAELKTRFREPNRQLAELTGLDLGVWEKAERRRVSNADAPARRASS
jgi:hypothetical protein